MSELNAFISQSLSPALAISGAGLLALGLQNRVSVLGGRVRQLNREILSAKTPEQADNLRRQVELFVKRANIIRNALLLLYSAIGLMILTAFALAMTELRVFHEDWGVPIFTFLLGLAAIFAAIVMECEDILLLLRTLHLDVELAVDSTEASFEE